MLTGLETFLLCVLSAFIASVTMLLGLTKKFVLKSECVLTHGPLMKALNEINVNQRILFRMLRAIVVNMEIPVDEKTKILNMSPGED